jgi:hypothetical protein
VDIILDLRRAPGNQSNRRTIEGLSRFDETPETTVIEMTDEDVRAGRQEQITRASAPVPSVQIEYITVLNSLRLEMDTGELRVHASCDRPSLRDKKFDDLYRVMGLVCGGDVDFALAPEGLLVYIDFDDVGRLPFVIDCESTIWGGQYCGFGIASWF